MATGPAALQVVLAAGLASSCDAIVGTPVGRVPDLGTVQALAQTGVDHLSVYELTIEDRTAFGARVRDGRMTPLADDVLAELYESVDAQLTAAGFEHYEISSYARPGKRAVHNSLYWRCAPFLGLGVGAASLELTSDGGGVRQTNPRKVGDYYAGTAAERIVSSPGDLAAERGWLGMRTSDGVAEPDLPAEIVGWLLAERLATRSAGRICPTLRGFLLANRIAARIAEAL
jgi:coproporphyrinogen III oxidase-like Fe-S oxidoreductase